MSSSYAGRGAPLLVFQQISICAYVVCFPRVYDCNKHTVFCGFVKLVLRNTRNILLDILSNTVSCWLNLCEFRWFGNGFQSVGGIRFTFSRIYVNFIPQKCIVNISQLGFRVRRSSMLNDAVFGK